MKPGDLVRLKTTWLGGGGVEVSWTPPGAGWVGVTHFDTGTPALLLQTDEVEFPRARRHVSFILIGGRMGWVWPEEVEPL